MRVEVCDTDGTTGVGYATQTPAITGDTLDGMERFVYGLASRRLLGRVIGPTLFGDLAHLAAVSPSATAAIDMALHQLHAPDHHASVATVTTSVTVSAGDTDAMVHAARRRIAEGFGHIKVKLGVDPDGDLVRLRRIVEAVDGQAHVWVDANQGWTLGQTLAIIETALARGVGPSMLEQPVRANAFDDLDRIARAIPIPVTADESARSLADIDRLADGGAVCAVNIKLMKFGGLTGSAAAAERARSHGMTVLIGSMMEHPHSVAAAVRFAYELERNRPTGLGGGTFTDDTGNVVHDLDAAWWTTVSDPCRYDAGRVSA